MIPAITYVWHQITRGDVGRYAMLPPRAASRLAEQSFTSGNAYRMIVQEERRSLEQNSKLWAMLTEVSNQIEHCGRHYSPDQWKAIFMHAWGQEIQFLPALDNSTYVPYGLQSSSRLSKRDMIGLLEFITAWGIENGVIFGDQAQQDRAAGTLPRTEAQDRQPQPRRQ